MLPLMYTYKRKKCARFTPNLDCLECQSRQCLTCLSSLACLLWEFSHSIPIQQSTPDKCSGIDPFVCLSLLLQNRSIERRSIRSAWLGIPSVFYRLVWPFKALPGPILPVPEHTSNKAKTKTHQRP